MIKIIEKGQKTFIRTCDRCGRKFQYDLSDLSIVDHIICPCCNTTLIHIGPNDKKVGYNDTDLSKTIFTPQKEKIGTCELEIEIKEVSSLLFCYKKSFTFAVDDNFVEEFETTSHSEADDRTHERGNQHRADDNRDGVHV